LWTIFFGAGLAAASTTGAGVGALAVSGRGWGTAIGLLELTGFGLSLEQPTVTEQTMSTAAKIKVLVFLPQIVSCLPQATELVSAMLRTALMRVIGLPPADERRLE
jgi:hypothetical protein